MRRKISIILLCIVLSIGTTTPCYAQTKCEFIKGIMYVNKTINRVVLNAIPMTHEKVEEIIATNPEKRIKVTDVANAFSDSYSEYADANEITVGSVCRELESKYNFKDEIHYISSYDSENQCGESVILEYNGPKYVFECNASYQWYQCKNAFGGCSKKINHDGKDSSFKTGEFDKPGIYYYYCVKVCTKRNETKKDISSIFAVAYTGLPTIIIDTPDGKSITSKEEYMGNSTITIRGNKEYEGLKPSEIKIKGRGNSTWRDSSKNSYTVKFDKKHDILGLGKNKTWVLTSNCKDYSMLRNWLGFKLDSDIFDSADWDNTAIPVDLVMNGEYRGSYNLSTSNKIAKDRIDIPDISDAEKEDEYQDYGFIICRDENDNDLKFTTERGTEFIFKDPDLSDPADEERNVSKRAFIKNLVSEYENVLYSENFKDPNEGYAKYLDVASFVDWYLIEEVSKNVDGRFNRSTYLYYDPSDKRIHMGPIWDSDSSFGNKYNDYQNVSGFACREGWFKRLFEDPYFEGLVIERWNEKKAELIEFVNNNIQQEADMVEISAKLNEYRWGNLGFIYHSYAPYSKIDVTYQGEVNYLINWLNARIEWMDNEFSW